MTKLNLRLATGLFALGVLAFSPVSGEVLAQGSAVDDAAKVSQSEQQAAAEQEAARRQASCRCSRSPCSRHPTVGNRNFQAPPRLRHHTDRRGRGLEYYY